jgi:hypothetical protein
MSGSDFDWRSEEDNECIAVHHQPAIAVYINVCDAVVIRQPGPDEDQCIFVTKDNVPKVVQALLEAAGFETATTYGEPLLLPKPDVAAAKSKPKDRTAAERQRRYRASKRDRGRDDRDRDCDEQSDGDVDVDGDKPHA